MATMANMAYGKHGIWQTEHGSYGMTEKELANGAPYGWAGIGKHGARETPNN